MKNLRKISLLLVVLLIFSCLSISVFADEVTKEEAEKAEFLEEVNFLTSVIDFVLDNYLYDISYKDILNGLYDGFFKILDDYSVHYTAEEYSDFSTDLSGEFSGVGVQIISKDGQIVVVTPIVGTPAMDAGLEPNDIIYSVDDVDISGYSVDEAANIIRGIKGTTVKLGIKRQGELIYFDIIRDSITISSVSSKVLDNNVGYLLITQFNHNTCELVEEKLSEFDELGVSDIVIDLRNNPGGSLDEVVDILNLFVPEGPLVYVVQNDDKEDVMESNLKSAKYNISVIVNKGSASASEIFAGAVKDRNIGEIVGTVTYGKGVVQTLYPLRNGHAIKLTTAEYFTAGKNKVHGIGITPDFIVENKTTTPNIDLSDYPELKKTRKPGVGIVGLDVLGTEMILQTLGYAVNEPDGILDEVTFEQIKKFQIANGLFGYGTLDFSTQDALTNAINEYAKPVVEDLQLQKAIECLGK